MLASIFTALIMAILLTLSITHLPLFLKRLIYYTSAWVWAGLLHFGYAGWIGGVTGHMIGLPLAVIMWFVITKYLHPAIKGEMDEAWRKSWVKRTADRIRSAFRRQQPAEVAA
jgi:hypothetical protein